MLILFNPAVCGFNKIKHVLFFLSDHKVMNSNWSIDVDWAPNVGPPTDQVLLAHCGVPALLCLLAVFVVKLNGGRHVQGILRGFDPFMNLVVDDTLEMGPGGQQNTIGMVVSTIASVVFICRFSCLSHGVETNFKFMVLVTSCFLFNSHELQAAAPIPASSPKHLDPRFFKH